MNLSEEAIRAERRRELLVEHFDGQLTLVLSVPIKNGDQGHHMQLKAIQAQP